MTDFFETFINSYSGSSSEEKPTTAAGYTMLNGSRWREVDTGCWCFYDLATDKWYSFQEYAALISGHAPTVDLRALDISEQILTTLKKIEYHLSIATDTNLNDQDVGG
jgi:hypothetical protein